MLSILRPMGWGRDYWQKENLVHDPGKGKELA
jgi:hypothetical protein